jgi:hypothetical protein
VIDDVTGARAGRPAGGRAGITSLEGSPRRRVPLDPAVCVALAGRATGRSGPGVGPGGAGSIRGARGTVAGFGAGFAAMGARFAAGNGSARSAGALTLARGGPDCDDGEYDGYEESAHTQGLSAEYGNCLREGPLAGGLGKCVAFTPCHPGVPSICSFARHPRASRRVAGAMRQTYVPRQPVLSARLSRFHYELVQALSGRC